MLTACTWSACPTAMQVHAQPSEKHLPHPSAAKLSSSADDLHCSCCNSQTLLISESSTMASKRPSLASSSGSQQDSESDGASPRSASLPSLAYEPMEVGGRSRIQVTPKKDPGGPEPSAQVDSWTPSHKLPAKHWFCPQTCRLCDRTTVYQKQSTTQLFTMVAGTVLRGPPHPHSGGRLGGQTSAGP